MSVTTPSGKRRHRSISIRTSDRSETMYCGLHVERGDIARDWREADCLTCIRRQWTCDWTPDDLNPGPECPYCAGKMCARFDGLRCTHDRIERHGI